MAQLGEKLFFTSGLSQFTINDVSEPKFSLYFLRSADTFELTAFHHDSNFGGKSLRLFYTMSGKKHRGSLPLQYLLDNVPHQLS